MIEVEIQYPDGSIDTFQSFNIDVLLKALDDGEILSFTIRQRTIRILSNPFKRKP